MPQNVKANCRGDLGPLTSPLEWPSLVCFAPAPALVPREHRRIVWTACRDSLKEVLPLFIKDHMTRLARLGDPDYDGTHIGVEIGY